MYFCRREWLSYGNLLVALTFLPLAGASQGQERLETTEVPEVEEAGLPDARGAETLFRWFDQTLEEVEKEGPSEIVTDRPDFTEASSTVGAGVFQIETGYTYIRDRAEGITFRAHSLPETLLRIGMFADWFELRVAQNYLNERLADTGGPFFARGFADLYVGSKLGLTEQSGILPEIALMPQMVVPTGDDDFNNRQCLPGLNWLYGWEVNDFISVGGSTQGNRTYDGVEYFMVFAQSVTINYALTDKLGMYTESFCFLPEGSVDPEVSPQYYFDSGFTYKVTRNLQLDIRGGIGLNEAADDFFAGAGLAYRLGPGTEDSSRPGTRVYR